MSKYKNSESIKTISDLKEIFPDAIADDMNWCVFSTSGIHGSYATLDELEKDLEEDYECHPCITVLVIQPRIVSMSYGHIAVNREDIPYLRKLANSSLESIKNSQKGNL